MDMNHYKQQQLEKTIDKNVHHYQRIQKGSGFKKKYRRLGIQSKAIPKKRNNQYQRSNTIIRPTDMKTVSLISESMTMKKKYFPLDIDTTSDPTQFLSDYSILSNMTFKEMLLLKRDIDTNSFVDLFDNEEILTLIRQFAQLFNKKNYFKLQIEQWSYYYELGINEGIWVGNVSKRMATVNSLCHTYGRSKNIIQQRQKKFTEQLKQMNNEIDEHLKQISTLTDPNRILSLITPFINQEQYPLHMEFERRREMLKFDAKEHQYVHAFYNLKPRLTEIHSAKVIWKASHDEQILRSEMAIFQHWTSLSSKSTTYTFDQLSLTKISHIFTQLAFNEKSNIIIDSTTQQEMFSTHDTVINDLIKQTLCMAEEMAQNYTKQVTYEIHKLHHTKEKIQDQTFFDTIIQAIQHRELNIRQRADYDTKQKLKILFPEKN